MPGSLTDTGGLISTPHLCFLQRHHWCQYLPRVFIHTVGAGSNKSKASGLCNSSWVHTRWHFCNVSAFGQCSCPFQGTWIKWHVPNTTDITVYYAEEAGLGFGSSHNLDMLSGTSLKRELIRKLWYFKLSYQSNPPAICSASTCNALETKWNPLLWQFSSSRRVEMFTWRWI